MNTKAKIGIASIVIGGIALFFIARSFTKPSFQIMDYTADNHSGIFTFSGYTNPFGSGSLTVAGRNGYSCQATLNPDGTTTFTLMKDGVDTGMVLGTQQKY